MFSDIAVSSMTTSRSSIDTLTCECEDGDAAVLAAFMGPVVAEYEKFDDAQKLIEGLNKVRLPRRSVNAFESDLHLI
jgi:hypothetical protein